MKVSFSKSEFLNKLAPIMITVSTKNTIPSIEGVLIETMPEGRLRLTSYDMLKGVRDFVEDVTVEEEGSYIIPGNRLLQIVRVLPDDEPVCIAVDSNYNVTISGGKSSFSLFAMKGADFPALPDLSGDSGFALSSAVLKKIIARTIHSVATQDSRPALAGAFFTFKEGRLEVVSCDSYTLSKCSVACEIKNIGEKKPESNAIIIPGHALNELIRMLPDSDEEVLLYFGFKHVIFHIDGVLFFTRLIDGDYVDYDRFIPKAQTIFLTLDRERFAAGLERAMLVAEEKYAGSARSYVKLTLEGNSLSISSTSAGGNVSDEMSCTHEGEDLEIGFNCRLLLNSVRAAEGDKIRVSLKAPTQSITIEPYEKSEESDFFYMVLPVRMNNAK